MSSDKTNTPRISVIIPCLNHGQFIEQAICSVLDQGYDNLELIVLDGGSEDDSVDIISIYEEDLAYWHSEWDSGPAEAINAGLVRSTGQIICILADDGDPKLSRATRSAFLYLCGKRCVRGGCGME